MKIHFYRKKTQHFFILLLLFALSSCIKYEPVTFGEIQNLKVHKLNMGDADFSFDIKINNPNDFSIAIKETDLKVWLEGEELGELVDMDLKEIPENSEQVHHIKLKAKLNNPLKGLVILLSLSQKNETEVKAVGEIKVRAVGFNKTIEFEEVWKVKL